MGLVFRCKDLVAVLVEDREDALAPLERATFRFHERICVNCQRFRAQHAALRAVLRKLGEG